MENCDIQCLVSRSPSTETWEMWNPIKLNCYWVESVYLVAAAQQSSKSSAAVVLTSWLGRGLETRSCYPASYPHNQSHSCQTQLPSTIQSEVKKSKKLVREALKTVGNTVEQIHFFVFTSIILEGKDLGSQHYIIPRYSTKPCFGSSILPFLFLEYIWGIPILWRLFFYLFVLS